MKRNTFRFEYIYTGITVSNEARLIDHFLRNKEKKNHTISLRKV